MILPTKEKTYYESLDIKDLNNNRKFWNTVKPLFSTKSKGHNNITLIDNNNIVTSDNEVAEILTDTSYNQ